jgi:zinc transporter
MPRCPDVFTALREGLASTRIERADDSLVAVLNDVNFEFNFESADIATLWICLDERPGRHRAHQPLRSVDALRDAVRRGDSPASTAELLEHPMRTQADVLVKVVRETTARVDDIEDAILAQRYHRHPRAHLGRLRRLLVSVPPAGARAGRAVPPAAAAPAGWARTTGAAWPPRASSRSCCATCRPCRTASSCCRKKWPPP